MKKNFQRIAFITILFVSIILFYAFRLDKYFSYQNVLEVKKFILSLSFLGPAIIILFFVLLNVVALPNVFFVFLSGYLYGFFYGFILGYIGTALGFVISFLTTRYLFKEIFKKKYGTNKLVVKIEEQTKKNKIWSILFFRTFFIIPYSIQNIAYALTEISFGSYLFFSLIGSIPQTILFALLGHFLSSEKINLKQFNEIFFIVVIVLSVIASIYFTSILIKNKKQNKTN